MSVGRSKQPTKKLQRNIIRLARKFNWMNGLPKEVQKRIKKGGSGLPDDFAEGKKRKGTQGTEWMD